MTYHMSGVSGIGKRARDILEESVLKGNTSALFNSLTEEGKAKTSISELSRRLASSEEQHGIFTSIGEPSEPYPDPNNEGFWICDIPIYAKENEWFARFSMNNEYRINDFSFSRKPVYVPPYYFNPHKIEVIQLCDFPIVRYMRPTKRKTLKLPIAVFVHSVVQVDYDGKIGLRYVFRDLDFLAQNQIGLVRSSYEGYGEPDTVVSLAKRSIEAAMKIEENGGLFLIIHSFASLFLDRIVKCCPCPPQGIVLINPAWEAVPGSGLENMTAERIPKGIPILVVGSECDQIMIKDHFDTWRENSQSDSMWLENVDHFLMHANAIPETDTYMKTEAHIDEHVLTKIINWIKANER